MPGRERLPVTRLVSTPVALDAAAWPEHAIVMRTAPDEVLLIGGAAPDLEDEWAIVLDDAGWSGVWLDAELGETFLRHACEWRPPSERPAFAQGMVAQLAVKIWFEQDRMLLVTIQTVGDELADRIDRVLAEVAS